MVRLTLFHIWISYEKLHGIALLVSSPISIATNPEGNPSAFLPPPSDDHLVKS
jgi:hypothetical protein